MAQRSTGVFPREKFDLDGLMELGTGSSVMPISLKSIRTIRVIVLGASGIDNAGTNKITVNVGGKSVVFNASDLDANGVGIAYLRGTLCDASDSADYDLGGTASVSGVYLDAVDNVG